MGQQATSTVAVPGQATVSTSFRYVTQGDLDGLTRTSSGTSAVTDLSWDTQSRERQVLTTTEAGATTAYGYLGGRPVDLAEDTSGDVEAGSFGYDAAGNPVARTMGGLESAVGRFGPYGETTTTPNTEPAVGVGFQGELSLGDGLTHLRARNYDPSTGAFTSRDPLDGLPGTNTFTNAFTYADGDPVNVHDPLGLRGEPRDPCKDNQGFRLTDVYGSAAHGLNIVSGHVGVDLCQPFVTAVNAARDFTNTILPYVAAVVAGALATAACGALTAGAGSLGCVMLGGAVGGAVLGATQCSDLDANCRDQIIAGAALGGLTAGLLGGGIAAAAATKTIAPWIGGAIGGGLGTAATQVITGQGLNPIEILAGAALGGLAGKLATPRTPKATTARTPATTRAPSAARAPSATRPPSVSPTPAAARRLVTPRALPSGSTVNNAGSPIRSFVTETDQTYYRVFSGQNRTGGFLTGAPPASADDAVRGLALPPGNRADFIQEVTVPAGTRLQSSVATKAFGQPGGLLQFELIDLIDPKNFGAGRPFR